MESKEWDLTPDGGGKDAKLTKKSSTGGKGKGKGKKSDPNTVKPTTSTDKVPRPAERKVPPRKVRVKIEPGFEHVHEDPVTHDNIEIISSESGTFNFDIPEGYYIHETVLGEQDRPKPDYDYKQKASVEGHEKKWVARLKLLAGATTIAELCQVLMSEGFCGKTTQGTLEPLPTRFVNVRLDTDPECLQAKMALPLDILELNRSWTSAFAIRTPPDGNCFFRTISRLVYGDTMHHVEMRVRCIFEGVMNSDRYTDERYLKQHIPLGENKMNYGGITQMGGFILLNTCNFLRGDEKNPVVNMKPEEIDDWENIVTAYGEELLRMCKMDQFAGIWQIHQMVHVVKRTLRVHYPDTQASESDYISREYKRAFNMDERLEESDRIHKPLNIAWTFAGNEGRINHFVSVVE